MWPLAALAIRAGTMNGDTRPGPFSISTVCCCSRVEMPPIPVAWITPPRSAGTSGLPASSHASAAEDTAKWTNRSVRRISLGSSQGLGSKSGTSPATETGRSPASKAVIARMPLRPVVSPAQNSSTPVPTGVTGPMPVTTTRSPIRSLGRAQLLLDERHGLPDRLDALHLLFGDVDAPLLLEGEHRLDEVERIGVEVLGESGIGHDLGLVDSELFGKDLADPSLDLCLVHPSSYAVPACGLSETIHATGRAALRLCGQPAIHGDDRAVHVRRLIGHQEPNHVGDLLQMRGPAERRLVEVVGARLVGQVRRHFRVEQARADRVYGDALATHLAGERLRQAHQPRLGGGIDRLPRVAVQ